MSNTPYPPITRDLAMLPGESHVAHIERISRMHTLPGTGAKHRAEPTVVDVSEMAEPTAGDIEKAARQSDAALERLAPKKTRKTTTSSTKARRT